MRLFPLQRAVCSMTVGLLLLACHAPANAQSDPRLPFPQNRVKDFYARQAEQFLDRRPTETSSPLPQFPGLDGGGFGHWGQNPEDVSFDHSLNDVDTGNVVCQLTHHFGTTTAKGVNVLLSATDKTTVLFDPEAMTYVDAWRGQFVKWGFVRFGLMEGVQSGGNRLWAGSKPAWIVPEGTVRRYRGYHRSADDVVFEYLIGKARVLDHCRFLDGQILRIMELDGSLPEGTALQLCRRTKGDSVSRDDNQKTQTISIVADGVTRRYTVSEESGVALTETADSVSVLFKPGVRQVAILCETLFGKSEEYGPAKLPPDSVALTPILNGHAAKWTSTPVTTAAVPGDDSGPIAIDTLTLPKFPDNPFKTAIRVGGVGCLSDGRVVIATLMGDVWLVDGLSNVGKSNELRWQRIAAGLYRALGLVVQDDRILVLGSDQITRLHDLNGDMETDFYECVTNEYPTTGGHDFCTSLQQDRNGTLYWSVSAHDFGVARMDTSGKIDALGSGLRNSNGIGVSPDGSVVLCSVQEGTWTPASAIFEVSKGSYHGLKGPKPDHGKYGYDLPLCFLPRGLDNSSGEIDYLPVDPRLGVLSGAAIGTSFGACQAYVVLRDVVNGKSQGTVVPLPGDFLSGVCRVAFNAKDGHVYFGGTEGWQSYAAEDGCLQRYRLTGKPLTLPTAVEAHSNGVVIRFSESIDAESVTRENIFCQQWNYLYSAGYGSPEFSVREPGIQGHDYVPVKSARLLPDGKSVFLEIPQLHPVMQFHCHVRFRTAAGNEIRPDLFSTILNLRPDYTDFGGYQKIAKRAAPEFPVPEKYEQDPRLVQQEQYGTNFGWVSSSMKISINAAAGLQFEPRVLRVPPGAKVSLAFRNGDPGMPHNVAVVRADAIDEFGEQSMQLASNPRAIATHYVPDDPRELCFSPILQPGDSYTLYFEAPNEPGEYRLVCTYPGHWRVMQGSLFVLPEGAALPETAFAPVRSFVRMWTTKDLADAADNMKSRSFERGKQVFESAGCIKCHKMNNAGSTLGPELTKVAERFKGQKLLQQVLEPSTEINKQYQTWVAVHEDGRAMSGLKVAEDATSITLMPNPLKPENKVTLAKDELEEIEASQTSTMPQNLLITYSNDEILDLLAYIQAGGDASSSVFAGAK